MESNKEYWFPAKPYGAGWGWGLPITWQGWIVFISFFSLVTGGAIFLAPHSGLAFFAFLAVISATFILICLWKGEPQHSRPR
jgi:hypothetical protein